MTAAAFLPALILCYSVTAAIYPIPPNDEDLWQDTLHRFWQPPERVWLSSGKSEIAYPLGEEAGWQVLLSDDRRIIQYVKPDDLTARKVCTLEPQPKRLPLLGSGDVAISDPEPCYPKK